MTDDQGFTDRLADRSRQLFLAAGVYLAIGYQLGGGTSHADRATATADNPG